MIFQSISDQQFVRHAFLERVPGLDLAVEREEALGKLKPFHLAAQKQHGMGEYPLITAEQIHGNGIGMVGKETFGQIPRVDGLITDRPGVVLGIYVADCCAVYLVDPVKRCIGLVHSGAKGTRLGIVPEAIRAMTASFGSAPADIVVQLSPCIRPPLYEVDFATEIVRQCKEAGVTHCFDCGLCTGSDLERFYSYRIELGKTGRMLALLAML